MTDMVISTTKTGKHQTKLSEAGSKERERPKSSCNMLMVGGVCCYCCCGSKRFGQVQEEIR